MFRLPILDGSRVCVFRRSILTWKACVNVCVVCVMYSGVRVCFGIPMVGGKLVYVCV